MQNRIASNFNIQIYTYNNEVECTNGAELPGFFHTCTSAAWTPECVCGTLPLFPSCSGLGGSWWIIYRSLEMNNGWNDAGKRNNTQHPSLLRYDYMRQRKKQIRWVCAYVICIDHHFHGWPVDEIRPVDRERIFTFDVFILFPLSSLQLGNNIQIVLLMISFCFVFYGFFCPSIIDDLHLYTL